MNNIPAYKTKVIGKETSKIQFLFESIGIKPIVKAIQYSLVKKQDGRKIYNLGFGDFNELDGTINDNSNSNNGDMRKVFSTVLNTVPKFFSENKEAAIWVQGSDSTEEFKTKCALTCNKNCKGNCKKYNRRIKTYRYYVDKNFVELSKEYIFFGLIQGDNPELVQYVPKMDYTAILVYKKKWVNFVISWKNLNKLNINNGKKKANIKSR